VQKGFRPFHASGPTLKHLAWAGCRKAAEGVKKSSENRNSLTQRRRVAKQTKEFWLSDLCALAPLRDGFSFFHSFAGFPQSGSTATAPRFTRSPSGPVLLGNPVAADDRDVFHQRRGYKDPVYPVAVVQWHLKQRGHVLPFDRQNAGT